MKRPCRYKCRTAEANTIKPIFGSTEVRAERWCSTSDSGGDGMDPDNFSDPSTASCKPMVTPHTIVWAARVWCMLHAIRKFKDAVKVNPADTAAITIVTLIEEL